MGVRFRASRADPFQEAGLNGYDAFSQPRGRQ